MRIISRSMLRAAALTSAIILFAANGFSAFASGYSGSHSPSFYTEDIPDDEGGQDDAPSVSSDQGGQQDVSELISQYSARVKSALDELDSHARAMIAAGNAGDRDKYDSELQAFENAEKLVSRAIDSSDGIPWDDAAPIADKAYDRLYSINKLREQAETALANSLGGAMDEDGNIYQLSKVKVKIVEVGKSNDKYDEALRGLGPSYKENENHILYKISLFVGKKPVHLIGGLTKSVTIGIPNDRIGRSPVSSYYLWDDGDGNQGASVADKRGYFDTSTWCLTVKVSKYVTYYIVCGRPGSKADDSGDDVVAAYENGDKLTAYELLDLLNALRLEDGDRKKVKAMEAVKPEGKSSAVFEIALPDGVSLLPDAQALAEIVCPEAAEKAVEVYRISETDEAEWAGSFIADEDGRLQFTTESFGVFVLCWHEDAQEETPAVVTPTDAESGSGSVPVILIAALIAAAAAAVCGAAFLIIRSVRKK